MDKFEASNEIEFFNDHIDQLTEELLCDDLNEPYSTLYPLKEEEIRRSAWIASILANSPEEEHQEKALAFATLAYTKFQDNELKGIYKQYLYIILSRLNNLPAFDNVRMSESEGLFEQELFESYDAVLSHELESVQEKQRLDQETILSGFQSEIYGHLRDGKNVAISGPTSSGKSFILREYIEHQLKQDEDFEVIYVVPTRALISEVSTKLSERFDDIEIQTGAYFNEDNEDENVFLVVTPERCLNLVSKETRNNISPSLIFFDEIQNLEAGERGVLLESIIQSISEYWPQTQIVAAGPYLQNPGRTLASLTESEVKEVETAFAPVLQLKVVLNFLKNGGRSDHRKMNAEIYSPSGRKINYKIDEPGNITYSEFDSNKKKALPVILEEFAQKSKNIVYASRRDYAEDRAVEIAEQRERRRASEKVNRLIEFLKKSIHDEYSLVKCLQSGIAYHHGMVPKIAREELEEIYRESEYLDTIVSTPTLLQGVSLPAEKIFLVGDKKGRDDLTSFDFNNLIGRVGRLDTKLYGSIYCLSTEEDDWAEDQFENSEEKEIEPVTSEAINRPDELINSLTRENIREEEDGALRYTSILLRNRYLNDDASVREYLNRNDMDQNHISKIETVLDSTLNQVDVPTKIIKKAPTVDPVLQDLLYKDVEENPRQWVIADGRAGYSYEKFEQLCKRLNRIFKFTYDRDNGIDPPENEANNQIGPVVFAANQWLNGRSYKEMIEKRIESDKVNDDGVNDSISNLFELIDDDIKFVLVKYFGVLTRVIGDIYGGKFEWMESFDQMLEMGSMNFNEIHLISKGVDRSVVVDLRTPPHVDDIEEYLKERQTRIPPFYVDHLQEQGIL